MADPHKNFAYSTVATAPSPATSGTSLVVQAGDGAKFPSSGSFNATVWPVSAQPTTANAEIVRVTAISTDTFTITRAQESTSARTIVVGDQIAETITAKTLTDTELCVYVTDQDKTIPATTEVIFDDYLELSASFFYELSTDAILVIGDFATPLPPPDQNPNIFISVANETIPQNSEIIFSDYYEVSAPFASEISVGGLMQVGTNPVLPACNSALVRLTSGDLTSSSATFVDLTGVTVTMLTSARRVLVSFSCIAQHTTAGTSMSFDLAVDGTRQGGAAGLVQGTPVGSNAGNANPSFTYLTDVLAATTHTFQIQWIASGTTGKVFASSTSPAILSVIELPT